jgi:hypothetical protein
VLEKFRGDSETGVLTPTQVQSAITAGRLARTRGASEADAPVAAAADPDDDDDDDDSSITPGGLTALHHAARQGHVEAVRALVEGGADVNRVSGQDNWTPLLIATTNGQWDVAMLLIENGANPNTANAAAGIAPLWSTINARWSPERTRTSRTRSSPITCSTAGVGMPTAASRSTRASRRSSAPAWARTWRRCGCWRSMAPTPT